MTTDPNRHPLARVWDWPQQVRAGYYRVAVAVGGVALAVAWAAGGDVAVVSLIVTSVLGLVASVLATFHTARVPGSPADELLPPDPGPADGHDHDARPRPPDWPPSAAG